MKIPKTPKLGIKTKQGNAPMVKAPKMNTQVKSMKKIPSAVKVPRISGQK